jgi:hypothetical protein
MQGVFFKDPGSLITGELPSSSPQSAFFSKSMQAMKSDLSNVDAPVTSSSSSVAWNELIASTSLEDLVKGSKLRLEKVVTTPSAYAGGGYAAARTEFSLQAVLFAIIEDYPSQEVRWKASAAIAKERMARQAASAKVGSIQAFQAAKNGLLDLSDLLNGSRLSGPTGQDLAWSQLIDRGPLMQLLEWAQQDFVNPLTSSEQQFAEGKGDLRRYAELIAILGQMSIQPDMPDASDDDYVGFAEELIRQARRVTEAIELDDAGVAREAATAIGQSCQDCHDNFR